jgi:hypothetical protein
MSAFCDKHKVWVGMVNESKVLCRFAPPNV